jgi:hypothetical protein
MVGCHKGGVVAATIVNFVINFGGLEAITQISFDKGDSWATVGGPLKDKALDEMAAGTQMKVRWRLGKDVITDTFSLRGATTAINAVRKTCK